MRAAVIGAGGGVGAALLRHLDADPAYDTVHALARRPLARRSDNASLIDIEDEASIARAASAVGAPLDLLFVATGLLHDATHGPERSLNALDPSWLAKSFAVNSIGPALVLRHFVPLLPRAGRSVVALLSARVGSISDNRAGGWYGYRASKAALNMIVRCAAIEIRRSRPEAICVCVHPGTVDTPLSQPFQAGVRAGTLVSPDQSAERLLTVVAGLHPEDSGRCFGWDGQEIPP